MSRAAYFRYLEETALVVGPFIEKLLQPYREQHEGLYNELMLFTGPRLRRPLQKPALFRLVYEVCGGKDWERYVPVAAAFELLNISSYQANASFDHKLGTLTDEKKDAQFIAAMISRELATKAVRECRALSQDQVTYLERSISTINHHIYQAQYLDLFVLTTLHFERYEYNEEVFLKDYFSRCHHGSGFFNSEICFWAGKLASVEDGGVAFLKEFGDYFGTGLHLLNDLGDYVPEIEDQPNPRDYQDRYSDFRNGRLTIILYYLLTRSNTSVKTFLFSLLGKNTRAIKDLSELSRIVFEQGALSYAKMHAKLIYHKACQAITFLSDSDHYPILLQATSILRTNKFNTSFRKKFEEPSE
jgi:geranylgeranyl pyrophosphate synthase